MLTNT
jgi:glucokinase